jgi:DNA-binding transcriptional ArsR family regulator
MAEYIKEQGQTRMRLYFMAHPREAIECLAEDIRIYWRRVLEPHWGSISAILEADVLYKGRILALDGPENLFPDLHQTVKYASGEIKISPLCQFIDQDVHFHTGGAGVQLVPSLFGGCGRMFQLNPDCSMILAYRTRGTGLWYEKPPDPGYSLRKAVGSGRAQVLEMLADPVTTGELARRLHYTAGAVSQQLTNLKQAGLVESERRGKRVFHRLTARGENLLALFDTT